VWLSVLLEATLLLVAACLALRNARLAVMLLLVPRASIRSLFVTKTLVWLLALALLLMMALACAWRVTPTVLSAPSLPLAALVALLPCLSSLEPLAWPPVLRAPTPTMDVACLAMPTVRLAPERLILALRALPINLSWSVVLASATALLVNTRLPLVDVPLVLLTVPLALALPPTVSLALLLLLFWMETSAEAPAKLDSMWMVTLAVAAAPTAALARTLPTRA